MTKANPQKRIAMPIIIPISSFICLEGNPFVRIYGGTIQHGAMFDLMKASPCDAVDTLPCRWGIPASKASLNGSTGQTSNDCVIVKPYRLTIGASIADSFLFVITKCDADLICDLSHVVRLGMKGELSPPLGLWIRR